MKSTVLIVDDDASARTTIEAILSNDGYRLSFAEDGYKALKLAQAIQPDLIILDVMMPALDGFEVCRRIRATAKLAEIPVIILTALDDSPSLLQGIEAGADDFLFKPVDRQELRARVRTITRLNRYRTLLVQRESLRTMAQRVITAQEEERRRISRELHDDLGQSLTAHTLNLHNLLAGIPKGQTNLIQQVEGLIAEATDLHQKIRTLAQNLRPPMLDTLGLPLALITFCQELSNRTHIPVEVVIDPELPVLPDVYAVTLFRILQEGMNNIIKHAQAARIWVELQREDDQLSLTIQDDGQGFQVDAPRAHGIGLIGIQERLALVGGELNIRSRPRQGTVLAAHLPLVGIEKGEKEGV